jgi:hypothetical protein
MRSSPIQDTRVTVSVGPLLTLPYFACQALEIRIGQRVAFKNGVRHKKVVRTYKKYRSAPKGWPTRQNVTQNTELPKILPARVFIFSRGRVIATSGSWNIIPANATPMLPKTVSEKVFVRVN